LTRSSAERAYFADALTLKRKGKGKVKVKGKGKGKGKGSGDCHCHGDSGYTIQYDQPQQCVELDCRRIVIVVAPKSRSARQVRQGALRTEGMEGGRELLKPHGPRPPSPASSRSSRTPSC
jgi:hypothetical protein